MALPLMSKTKKPCGHAVWANSSGHSRMTYEYRKLPQGSPAAASADGRHKHPVRRVKSVQAIISKLGALACAI